MTKLSLVAMIASLITTAQRDSSVVIPTTVKSKAGKGKGRLVTSGRVKATKGKKHTSQRCRGNRSHARKTAKLRRRKV
jgi:hypothetical protein